MRALPRVSTFLAVAFTSVMVAGCGGAAATPPPAFEGDTSQALTIRVENQQLDEARIWLRVDGQRVRLGDVRANANETFHHPMTRITEVHMEFDLTLGRHCVTEARSLGPGDYIEATIPVNLQMMRAVCRAN